MFAACVFFYVCHLGKRNKLYVSVIFRLFLQLFILLGFFAVVLFVAFPIRKIQTVVLVPQCAIDGIGIKPEYVAFLKSQYALFACSVAFSLLYNSLKALVLYLYTAS